MMKGFEVLGVFRIKVMSIFLWELLGEVFYSWEVYLQIFFQVFVLSIYFFLKKEGLRGV